MLLELHVRNLALIEEARVEFGQGLNVLSGETGAGKTMLVEALSLLLGGRGDSGLVRSGAPRLELEAGFAVATRALLAAAEREGLELEGDEVVVLRRVLGSDGKSRCYVNGVMCAVSTLSRLGEYLVDIHGQHEHQRLLRPASHVGYLDASGPPQHQALLRSYRERYREWKRVRAELEGARSGEAERLREMEELRFQVGEIEAADPRPGELEELLALRGRMQNSEELFLAAREAYMRIAGGAEGEGAVDLAGAAEAVLERACSLDGDLSIWTDRLRGAQGQLSDLAQEMRAYLEGLDFEPGRLEEVEQRLSVLSELARKYGRDSAAILEHLEEGRRRLAVLAGMDTRREELQEAEEAQRRELETAAEELAASRRGLAEELARDVNTELAELNMAGMRFAVEAGEAGEYGESGREAVEFKVSPGRGLPFRPMARIASGGELSRIMLALKLVLARADDVPTLVFDEVDAGIGGNTADVLAVKLSRISRYHQVFSITHLPQLAACADNHIVVSKREAEEGIETWVKRVEGEEREGELARMLGGDESTALRHARSMLRRKEDLST